MKIVQNLIILIALINTSALAQNEGNIWMMGFESDPVDSLRSTMILDFNENPLNSTQIFQDFGFHLSSASIANKEGELVCYSNGIELRNSSHETIVNGQEFQTSGSNAIGYPMSQGALILPVPDTINQYLFLLGDFVYYEYEGWLRPGIAPLTYSYIDMNLNSGIGEVIEKKSILCTDTLSAGLLTATRHANGRDWWILMNKNETNHYYRFLLNPDGIVQDGFQTIGDTVRNSLAQAAFSSDGNWYAQYNAGGVYIGSQTTENSIDLYQFDRCTGLLSNHLQIMDGSPNTLGGVSFSPSSRFMYISRTDIIYQFDLEAMDIVASRDTIAVYDGFEGQIGQTTYPTYFFMMQTAPDGKIYISCTSVTSQYLHIIEHPDSAGITCNVLQHELQLPSFYRQGIPNLPNFHLGALDGSACDTLGPIAAFNYLDDMLEVTFEDQTSRDPTTWNWDFGDNMTSDEQDPVHNYSAPGTYEVCLIASNAIGSDTVCQEITLMVDQVIELNESLGLQVYPNPTDDFLYLDFNNPLKETYQFHLVDYTGKELLSRDLSQNISKHSIGTSQFPAGLYMYYVNDLSGELIVTGKFVISR